MPIPDEVFETLRLSKFPEFKKLSPADAATFARMAKEYLQSPELTERLGAAGLGNMQSKFMGTIDVSTSEEALTASREAARPRESSVMPDFLTQIGEGAASTVVDFGADEPLLEFARIAANIPAFRAARSLVSGEEAPLYVKEEDPGSVPETAFPHQKGDVGSVELPVLGDVNAFQLGGQLAAFLAPVMGAIGTAGAGLSAAGLTAYAPGTASTLSFATGGGAIEAARQALRSVYKDEPFDAARVAKEAIIFGVGGIPMRAGAGIGNALINRAAGGAAVGGASAVLGETPERTAMETAFGLLFGNPRIAKAIRPPKVDLPTKAEIEADVAITSGEKIPDRPPEPDVAEFASQAKELETDVGILSQLQKDAAADPEGATAPFMARRAQAATRMSKLSHAELNTLFGQLKADDTTGHMILRDARALKDKKSLHDTSAPPENTTPPGQRGATVATKESTDRLAKLQEAGKRRQERQAEPKDDVAEAEMDEALRVEDEVALTELDEAITVYENIENPSAKQQTELQQAMEARERLRGDEAEVKDSADARSEAQLEAAIDKVASGKTKAELEVLLETLPNKAGRNADHIRQQLEKHLKVLSEPKPKSEIQFEQEILRLEREQGRSRDISDEPFKTAKRDPLYAADATLYKFLTGKMLSNKVSIETFPDMGKQLTRDEALARMTELSRDERLAMARLLDPNAHSFGPGDTGAPAAPPIPLPREIGYSGETGTKAARTVEQASRTKKGLSFADIKTRGDQLGAVVTPGKTGFDTVVNGKKSSFTKLKDVDKYLDDVEKLLDGEVPKAPTHQVTEAAALRKLKLVTHTGKGEYQVVDQTSGKATKHKNLKDATKAVADAPVPHGKEIIPGAEGTVAAGGTAGGPTHQGRFPIDPSDAQSFPGSMGRFIRTRGSLMEAMEDATGVPLYTEVWIPGQDAIKLRDMYQTPMFADLREIFRPVPVGRRHIVQELMVAGDKLAEVSKNVGAKAAEVHAFRELQSFYRTMLGLNPKQLDEIFTEMIPAFRESGGSPQRTSADWTLPEKMEPMIKDIYEGNVHLEEPNAQVLASEMIMSMGRHQFMGPLKEQVRAVQKKLTGQIIPKKGMDPNVEKQAKVMSTLVDEYMDGVLNGHAGDVGGASAKVMNTILKEMQRVGLFSKTTEFSARDIDSAMQQLTGHVSSVAMSARPALAVRNMFQRMLPGYKVGFDTVWAAQKEARTPEGFQAAKAAGVIPREVIWAADDVLEAFAPANIRSAKNAKDVASAIGHGIKELQAAGMKFYRSADHNNRVVSFLAGRQSIAKHADLLRPDPRNHKVSASSYKEFMIETGLAGESLTMQTRVLRHLDDVQAEGWPAAVEKAGREYGIKLARDSQYVYNRANAPQMFQGIPGRMFGQFGLWNVSYAEYMLKNAGGSIGTAPSLKRFTSGRASLSAREQVQRRFMGRALKQRAALVAAGAALGVDMSSFNGTNPIDFEGGPTWQLTRDVITLATHTGNDFDQRQAYSGIIRFAKSNVLPFGALLRDIREAIAAVEAGEENPLKILGLVLGFNLTDVEE